jgi:hypothetical protein
MHILYLNLACSWKILSFVRVFSLNLTSRVARWFVFKPKIPIWVSFVGSCNGKSWYILWSFGLFYGHCKYFMNIWYILWSFGVFYGHLVYFSPFWYFVQRKIWQPCWRVKSNLGSYVSFSLPPDIINSVPPYLRTRHDNVEIDLAVLTYISKLLTYEKLRISRSFVEWLIFHGKIILSGEPFT